MLIFHVTNNHAFNFDSMNIVFVFQSGHIFVLNSGFVESRKQIQIWSLARFSLQRGNLNFLQMYGLSLGPAKFRKSFRPFRSLIFEQMIRFAILATNFPAWPTTLGQSLPSPVGQ